jgi:hypothetical protein
VHFLLFTVKNKFKNRIEIESTIKDIREKKENKWMLTKLQPYEKYNLFTNYNDAAIELIKKLFNDRR